jgi:hypothetical protein
MLTVRDHTVEDYAALRDMDATDVGVLDAADQACLDELGEYLVSTDSWQRFAVWLLHKHFEPAAGEVFVESVITAPRGTVTTPVERSACSGRGLSPTSMRFGSEVSDGVGVIGMEFADAADFGSASPVSSDDEAVLTGIAQRLGARGKTERFGVRLIRNPLGLAKDEVLLETCDLDHRMLHCSVGARNGARAGTTVETTWQWTPSPSGSGRKPIQDCITECPTTDGDHVGSSHMSG